jgi:hypothetical protein
MGRTLMTSALALAACLAVGGEALARGGRCAAPEEVSAIQAAAIQQELMVAALTCNEVTRFNAFQTGFGPELRVSDGRLEHLFRRLDGARRGEAEYHAFKTKLANDASIRSIHDNPAYCQEAASMFMAALVPQKPALVTFAVVTPVTIEQRPVDACATGAAVVVSAPGHRRLRHRVHSA